MNKHVAIENVGPIENFEFDLPESGMVVIHGANGIGKTTVLTTAEILTNGRGNLVKREGARSGEVHGLGKTLRVKQRTTQSGDLEVEGVGDLDVLDLHSPRFKDHAARDRHRIKTLCRLSGVEANIDDFRGLVDTEEFDRSVGERARESTDLVEMAAAVKRDLEKRSRDYADQAERLTAEAKAKQEACADVDLSVPDDKAALEADQRDAIEHRARIVQRHESATVAIQRAAQARKKLEQAESEYNGPTPAEAAETLGYANSRESDCAAEVQRLEAELAKAKSAHSEALRRCEHAEDVLDAAQRHESTIREWRETIEAAEQTDSPTEAEILEADRRVSEATEAVERGLRARDAKAAMEAARELQERAKAKFQRSERLREAAKETEAILSDAIQELKGCPLRVWFDANGDARLVIDTPRGANTLFDELSDGERWSVIIPLAMGPRRLICLPQAAYGELQPAKRHLLHELAVEHGCVILTAMADDGPLRAVNYSPDHVLEESGVGS